MIMIFVAGFISGCTATFLAIHILSFFDKEHNSDGPKQIKTPVRKQMFRYDSPVLITGGAYQGMHGKICGGKIGDEWHIDMPNQLGGEGRAAFIEEKYLRINVPEEAMIEID